MDQGASKSEVLAFTTKQKPRDGIATIDQAGQAIVAMLQEAANISSENIDRAMSFAHKLAIQLRAAEDRIAHLLGEVERLESRAASAERWLETIKQEIQEKLIVRRDSDRSEQSTLQ